MSSSMYYSFFIGIYFHLWYTEKDKLSLCFICHNIFILCIPKYILLWYIHDICMCHSKIRFVCNLQESVLSFANFWTPWSPGEKIIISKCYRLGRLVYTFSCFIYKACTQFKINFDHQFLSIENERYIIKIISLNSYFIKVFGGIILMAHNS
jgi:hypothetical protein